MTRLLLLSTTGIALALLATPATAHPPGVIVYPQVYSYSPPRVLPVAPAPLLPPAVGPIVPAPYPPPPVVVAPGIGRDFVVYVRPSVLAPWRIYGRYDTRLEANRVARQLECSGFLTRVESVPGW